MKSEYSIIRKASIICLSLFIICSVSAGVIDAAVIGPPEMNDYCIIPPFVGQTIPPLVMLVMGSDHKLFYEAYNDVFDYDGDGKLDITYNHSVEYYGYFDPYKCYLYDPSGQAHFKPDSKSPTKFCSGGQWSGNFMNWLTMSRMDVLRKVIYGGYRSNDSQSVTDNATILERAFIPQDAHSWGKEFTGKLCYSATTQKYTNQCLTALDCEQFETCEKKSDQLIGMSGPSEVTACTAAPVDKYCSASFLACSTDSDCPASEECVYSRTGRILVVRYDHDSTKTCAPMDHTNMMSSIEPQNYFIHNYVTNFDHRTLRPYADHNRNDFNIVATTDFEVKPGEELGWQFLVDGDDAAEVEIDMTVEATHYEGCNIGPVTACINDPNVDSPCYPEQTSVAKDLTPGWHRIIVRHFDDSSFDGVRVWYRNSTTPNWTIFGSRTLNLRAPNVLPGNECSLKATSFIETGDPYTGSIITGGTAHRHLFCNTTMTGEGRPPMLRMLLDRPERIWTWASKEGQACDDTALGSPDSEYEVRVAVCVQGLEEDNCRAAEASPPNKPAGLMQKYGLNHSQQVCSKSFTPCGPSLPACPAPEACVDRAQMYFGLMTGSYEKNMSGGLLRWNIDHVAHDVDNKNVGIINNRGMLKTLNNMRIVEYNYKNKSYDDCGWKTSGPPVEGECTMWGNPTAEIMYEGMRYFAGRPNMSNPAPTPEYVKDGLNDTTDPTGWDEKLNLPNVSDESGMSPDTNWVAPYAKYPLCSKPFMLVLSDVNPSYDSDQLPGVNSQFVLSPAFSGDLPGFDADSFTKTIGAGEGIDGNSYFIGQSGSVDDSICSSKAVANLSNIRGICPEEPPKQGSYYSAGVAYYGKMAFGDNNKAGTYCTGTYNLCTSDDDCEGSQTCDIKGLPDVTTYSVALSSPVPKIDIIADKKTVKLVPLGVSPSDHCTGSYFLNTESCADQCTLSYGPDGNLIISNCSTTSFCAGNQIVDFYAEAIRPDYGRFRINYEDVNEGADHDMDAIVEYEYCVGDACVPAIGLDEIRIKLTSTYASGCIDQALGFVISGTTEDDTYLVVRDSDTAATDRIGALPTTWSKVFHVDILGGGDTQLLENPLWYAAKWGGFKDADGDKEPYTDATCGTLSPDPKCAEWDENSDGVPDTYFFVSNPLLLEKQLERAFKDILRRASSGTAVSVLASGEERGANMLQAVFYPVKAFGELGEQNDITWTGRLQNLWFYIDPRGWVSNIREDTVRDRVLRLDDDFITLLTFDVQEGKTKAYRCHDADGDGDCDTLASPDTMQSTIDFEELFNLWEFGDMLFVRNPGTRKIYTNYGDDTTLDPLVNTMNLTASTDPTGLSMQQMLDASSETVAKRIIDFTRGVDFDGYCSTNPDKTCNEATAALTCGAGVQCIPYRKRTATMPVKVCLNDNTIGCTVDADCNSVGGSCDEVKVTNTWKLGDIISSTPKVISGLPNNDYHRKYADTTYSDYINTTAYLNRGLVVVGGNDGMLHAIRHGKLESHRDFGDPTKLESLLGEELGWEEWAFVPKNALPYLKYMMDKDYCHLYFIDATPYIVDASIGNVCGEPDYKDCQRTMGSWRTIVIGSMRIGGACRKRSDATADPANNVVPPLEELGYSSYFALDVTDNLADPTVPPKLLWEFGIPQLGYSTSGPVVGRISALSASGNPDPGLNGRWFVVITSGSTGPIDTTAHEFKGESDQSMKIFVLDLAGDENGRAYDYTTVMGGQVVDPLNGVTGFDTNIVNAFGNGTLNPLVDLDFKEGNRINYQDDVIYLGYTVENATTSGEWTEGGVLRLMTHEKLEPLSDWEWSTVIDGIPALTSNVKPVRDDAPNINGRRLWLYFGTGRYWYRSDTPMGHDQLVGLIDPCYDGNVDMINGCNTKYTLGQLNDATDAPVSDFDAFNVATYKGWHIDLDCHWSDPACPAPAVKSPSPFSSERVITHPVAVSSGSKALVYFTSFTPTSDLCSYGAKTFLWAVDHATGGVPDASLLQGKALIQVSTGEIKEINLKDAFTEKPPSLSTEGRRTAGFMGVPPIGQGLSLIVQPQGTKRVLHMKEW